MHFLSTISGFLIDFLFPKSEAAKKLERFTSADMLSRFPSPRDIDDDKVIAVFDYQNQDVRDTVWEIKYKSNSKLSRSAAGIVYEILCQELAERALSENFQNPLLVPIPISNQKRRERGFSQTETICSFIKDLDKNNLLQYEPNILKKIRHTESQTRTHSKSERLQNLLGSMKVVTNIKPQNHSVVLFDDVYTTGATISEARRTLNAAGFKKVLAITLAH